jgi:hypothetical protein
LDGLAKKNVALRSFETSGTTHRMMQHHIAKDSHLHIFIDLTVLVFCSSAGVCSGKLLPTRTLLRFRTFP